MVSAGEREEAHKMRFLPPSSVTFATVVLTALSIASCEEDDRNGTGTGTPGTTGTFAMLPQCGDEGTKVKLTATNESLTLTADIDFAGAAVKGEYARDDVQKIQYTDFIVPAGAKTGSVKWKYVSPSGDPSASIDVGTFTIPCPPGTTPPPGTEPQLEGVEQGFLVTAAVLDTLSEIYSSQAGFVAPGDAEALKTAIAATVRPGGLATGTCGDAPATPRPPSLDIGGPIRVQIGTKDVGLLERSPPSNIYRGFGGEPPVDHGQEIALVLPENGIVAPATIPGPKVPPRVSWKTPAFGLDAPPTVMSRGQPLRFEWTPDAGVKVILAQFPSERKACVIDAAAGSFEAPGTFTSGFVAGPSGIDLWAITERRTQITVNGTKAVHHGVALSILGKQITIVD